MRPTPKLRQPRTRFALKAKPRFRRGSIKPRKECQWKQKQASSLAPNVARSLRPKVSGSCTQKPARRSIKRIGRHWENKPAVVNRGDREICNPLTDEGRAEYKWRTILMVVRQNGWCCFHEYDFCPGRLKLRDATFEHERKRTKAQQTDAISYIDEAGKERPLNGAAHKTCNGIAGSRKLPIDHGTNCSYQEGKAV